MSKRKRKRKQAGNGIGAHHQASPMGHATATPSRGEKVRRRDRKARQNRWECYDAF